MSMSKAFTAVATAFRANTLSGETSRPVQCKPWDYEDMGSEHALEQ